MKPLIIVANGFFILEFDERGLNSFGAARIERRRYTRRSLGDALELLSSAYQAGVVYRD